MKEIQQNVKRQQTTNSLDFTGNCRNNALLPFLCPCRHICRMPHNRLHWLYERSTMAEEDSQSSGWTTSLSELVWVQEIDAVKMTQDRDVWRSFVFGLNGPRCYDDDNRYCEEKKRFAKVRLKCMRMMKSLRTPIPHGRRILAVNSWCQTAMNSVFAVRATNNLHSSCVATRDDVCGFRCACESLPRYVVVLCIANWMLAISARQTILLSAHPLLSLSLTLSLSQAPPACYGFRASHNNPNFQQGHLARTPHQHSRGRPYYAFPRDQFRCFHSKIYHVASPSLWLFCFTFLQFVVSLRDFYLFLVLNCFPPSFLLCLFAVRFAVARLLTFLAQLFSLSVFSVLW